MGGRGRGGGEIGEKNHQEKRRSTRRSPYENDQRSDVFTVTTVIEIIIDRRIATKRAGTCVSIHVLCGRCALYVQLQTKSTIRTL